MGSSPRQLSPAGQKIALAVLCLIFMSVGLSLWIPGFLLPVLKWSSHKKWKETPCVITKAPPDEGGFRVEYRYEVDGETYAGAEDRDIGFFASPPSGLWQLKAGASTVCYVNPWIPREAVLSRDLDTEVFVWCAPLIFVIIPLFALIAGFLRLGRQPPSVEDPLSASSKESTVLAPESRRGCGVLMQLFFILVVGGLGALIVAIPGFRESLPVRLIYLAPISFVLLLLLYSLGLTILRSLNSRLTLTLTPGQGVPGREVEVRWDAEGGPGGVKRFRIVLEGREQVLTSSRGARTQTAVFALVDVFEGGPKDFKRGLSKVRIPAGTMHSLEHGSRKILWVFRLTADVAGLPNLFEEYPFQVAPGRE